MSPSQTFPDKGKKIRKGKALDLFRVPRLQMRLFSFILSNSSEQDLGTLIL